MRRVNTGLNSVTVGSFHVFADGTALILSDDAHQGENQAAGGLVCANTLFLKNNGDVPRSQKLDVTLALYNISRKTGDAFAQD